VVGHGPHVAVRTAGRHHQAVGHGAFALEIYEDDVLGLVLVEAAQDQALQGADAVLEGFGRRRETGVFLRARRG